MNFNITKLGKYKMVLRILWLSRYNLEIDQKNNKIQFTHYKYINNSKTTERDIEFQGTGSGNQVKPRIKPRGKVIKYIEMARIIVIILRSQEGINIAKLLQLSQDNI